MQIYLFGSRARGDHRPDSDFDVIFRSAPDEIIAEFKQYAIENGGRLDAFFFAGDCLLAVYDDERKIILSKYSWQGVADDATEITQEELLALLKGEIDA